MKLLCSLTAALLASLLSAAEPPTPPPQPNFTVVQRTVTVQLGAPILPIRPIPVVPTTVSPGTTIRILARVLGDTYGTIRWFKDETELATTGGTLEIASAASSDTGTYYALAKDANGRSAVTDQFSLFVSSLEGQRLRNVSVRAQLNATQPSFTSGFVVEPGPWSALVLIRVVGPSLARFGVADALATPQLRVFDQRGQPVAPAGSAYPRHHRAPGHYACRRLFTPRRWNRCRTALLRPRRCLHRSSLSTRRQQRHRARGNLPTDSL